MKLHTSAIAAAAALTMLAGCASRPPSYPASQPVPPAPGAYGGGGQQRYVEYGQVQSIDMVRAENQTSGAGAVIGGVVGAVVGRQFGSHGGRDAATAVGAVGGAIIGNQVEKQNRGAQDLYRVAIRTERGEMRTFDYAQLNDLRVGDRVRIDGNQVYRY